MIVGKYLNSREDLTERVILGNQVRKNQLELILLLTGIVAHDGSTDIL